MAIQLQFCTLVIRRSKVQNLYRDQIYKYCNLAEKSNIGVFRCDDYLVATGAMSAYYLNSEIEVLKSLGLDEGRDFDVVDFFFGKSSNWLEVDRKSEPLSCYLKGSIPGPVAKIRSFKK